MVYNFFVLFYVSFFVLRIFLEPNAKRERHFVHWKGEIILDPKAVTGFHFNGCGGHSNGELFVV